MSDFVNVKPLGKRNYGSIPHLPNSRMGPGDHACHEGQAKIATVSVRDKFDTVFVTEKLDGSNVGVARVGDDLYPLGRSGYLASTSPYQQHHLFHDWVMVNYSKFLYVLKPGERIIGEWLAQAHGTRYEIKDDPFVVFDFFAGNDRIPYADLAVRIQDTFILAHLLHYGGALSIENAMMLLGEHGYHGAIDKPEGAVWRVERERATGTKGERKLNVDFLVKFVRPDKVDGSLLPEITGGEAVWNWQPPARPKEIWY